MKFPVLNVCDLVNNEKNIQNYIIHDLKELLHEDIYLPKKPHRHTFYQILYIEKGSGTHKIDFEDYEIQDNSVFFLRPGQVHDLVFNHKNTKGFLINFNENLLNQFLLQANFIDQLPLFSKSGKNCYLQIKNNQKDIKYAFAKILDFNDGSYKYTSELIKLCILEILLLISEDIKLVEQNNFNYTQNNLVRKFEGSLEKYFKEEHYPKFYADQLAVTPNYLNSVCKFITGKTAGEMIRNRIILEAKRLLVNTQSTISQIAFELNFEDNSYFTKFFKSNAGVSPIDFRKNLNK